MPILQLSAPGQPTTSASYFKGVAVGQADALAVAVPDRTRLVADPRAQDDVLVLTVRAGVAAGELRISFGRATELLEVRSPRRHLNRDG